MLSWGQGDPADDDVAAYLSGIKQARGRRAVGQLFSLRVFIDQHIIDDTTHWPVRLKRLEAAGWVQLELTGTHVVESQNPELREQLDGRPISFGLVRLDHSASDYAVLGTEEDEQRFAALYQVVYPQHDPSVDGGGEGSRTGKTRFRDVMHLETVVRQAGDVFVTRDAKLLERSADIRAAGYSIAILSPRECVLRIGRGVAKARLIAKSRERPPHLPTFPSGDDLQLWESQTEGRDGRAHARSSTELTSETAP